MPRVNLPTIYIHEFYTSSYKDENLCERTGIEKGTHKNTISNS